MSKYCIFNGIVLKEGFVVDLKSQFPAGSVLYNDANGEIVQPRSDGHVELASHGIFSIQSSTAADFTVPKVYQP